jgi:nicotinate-nucleotide adenylyltransferase
MKVGVLGGTFDPIHLGHLRVAEQARKVFGFSQIHFAVAATPPHKRAGNIIPFIHRYAMVCLATARRREFLPSMVEIEPPASPFSIDTLRKLTRGGREGEIYFIAGGDSLLDVTNWRRSEELLASYNFVFVTRPGSGSLDTVDLPPAARRRLRDLRGLGPRALRPRLRAETRRSESSIYVIDVGALDISSSEIRRRAAAGTRIAHLLPPLVHAYIQKLKVYGER